jgi:hypothetical protein
MPAYTSALNRNTSSSSLYSSPQKQHDLTWIIGNAHQHSPLWREEYRQLGRTSPSVPRLISLSWWHGALGISHANCSTPPHWAAGSALGSAEHWPAPCCHLAPPSPWLREGGSYNFPPRFGKSGKYPSHPSHFSQSSLSHFRSCHYKKYYISSTCFYNGNVSLQGTYAAMVSAVGRT